MKFYTARFSVFSLFIIIYFVTAQIIVAQEKNIGFTEAIEDNSMLLEEAYNQEVGVVQHISNFIYYPKPNKEFLGSFTQEWPCFSQTHQLSYTLNYLSNDKLAGIGDIILNYRYQLTQHDDFVTIAPRLSVILPTGDKDKGLGEGTWGLQFNAPFSKRLHNNWAVHLNLGATYMNNIEEKSIAFKNSTINYNAGVSLIWLATYNINLFVEAIANYNANPDLDNKVKYGIESILNPGIRYAIDIGETQIVPGLCFPIKTDHDAKIAYGGMFFYLSVEHPF